MRPGRVERLKVGFDDGTRLEYVGSGYDGILSVGSRGRSPSPCSLCYFSGREIEQEGDVEVIGLLS